MNGSSTDVEDRPATRLERAIIASPEVILLAALALFAAVAITGTARALVWWTTLPIMVVAFLLLLRFRPAPPEGRRRFETIGAALAVLGAVAWVVVNAPFAAQLLVPYRDPSLYLALSAWLGAHGDPAIDVSGAVALADGVRGTSASLGVFPADASADVYLQGGDLLPGVLAVASWVAGLNGVLAGNLVLGGVAMVAIYGLARRFVGPVLALVPEFALAASVPFAYFARASFSEIIMLTVCIAALTWLIAAAREQRPWLAFVGGLFVGVAGFARIDAPAALVGSIVAIASFSLVTPNEGLRPLLRVGGAFAGGAVLVMGSSVVALALNDRAYLSGHLNESLSLWLVLGAAVAVAAVIVFVRTRMSGPLGPRATRSLAAIAVVAIGLLWVFWLSRPLWYEARLGTGPAFNGIQQMQEREGLPIDGNRSYEEQTMYWMVWYFGIVAVLAAGVGFAMLLRRGLLRRELGGVILVFATLAVTAMYFTKVAITPDQIWAYRRLLPIVTPGFLVAAVVPVAALFAMGGFRRVIAVLGAAAVALAPILSWNGLLIIPEGRGELAMTQEICESVDGHDILFFSPHSPPNYALTLRTVCDVEVVTVDPATVDLEELAERDPDLRLVWWGPEAFDGEFADTDPDVVGESSRWRPTLMGPPAATDFRSWSAWIGEFSSDGTPRLIRE